MELTPFLNSTDSLINQNNFVPGYDFDSNNDTGIISTSRIKDASITTAKIGTAQITAALIADAAITNAKIGTAVIGTANIGTLSFNEISGGTINVLASLGTANIKLDGANKQIIINDGTNDRILIGYQSGGF